MSAEAGVILFSTEEFPQEIIIIKLQNGKGEDRSKKRFL
jgi:hypothetical protein